MSEQSKPVSRVHRQCPKEGRRSSPATRTKAAVAVASSPTAPAHPRHTCIAASMLLFGFPMVAGCEAGSLGQHQYRIEDGAFEALGEATTGMPEVGFLTAQLFRGDAMCTATLIAPDRVVTAQHCVSTTAARHGLAFVLGDSSDDPTRQTFAVSRVAPHSDSDLAVLTLAQPTPFRGLPFLARALAPGERVTLVGFGETGWDSRRSGHKRVLQVPVSGADPDDSTALRLARMGGCVGEAGGAALIEEAGQWHIAAIGQSARLRECERGSLYARLDGARAAFLLSAAGIAAMAVCAQQGQACSHHPAGIGCCAPFLCSDSDPLNPAAGARCALPARLAGLAKLCSPGGLSCNHDQDCCDWHDGMRCLPGSPAGAQFSCQYAPQRPACRLRGEEESCAQCSPVGAFCNTIDDCCPIGASRVRCENRSGGGGQCVVFE